MSSVRIRRVPAGSPVKVYEDTRRQEHADSFDDESGDEMDESRGPLEDSGCTGSDDSEDEEDEVDTVLEDMRNLGQTFAGFNARFRLISRIGEGTFSTVYKAEDLQYDIYRNDWDIEAKENLVRSPSGRIKRRQEKRPHYVAIKKIYVTSSPSRIMNELDLLHDLRGCRSIAPLITAFRHQDQVVAILPYFSHSDFRTYFREMSIGDMRIYFRSLFTALAAVHDHGIIHRDVKPTNFLYNPSRRRGVLVDFGLAEREGTDAQPCMCQLDPRKRRDRLKHSYTAVNGPMNGYPKEDKRPSLRANRAGTRGFRAPEVLFKCTAQTTKIDIWSAGVMLLTILCKRFPFFHSADDVDAVIELASIFGNKWMRTAAVKHGHLFETNLPTITDNGYSTEKIVMWSVDRKSRDKNGNKLPLREGEKEAFQFMDSCLHHDPDVRISARDALNHPFLATETESEDEMDCLAIG